MNRISEQQAGRTLLLLKFCKPREVRKDMRRLKQILWIWTWQRRSITKILCDSSKPQYMRDNSQEIRSSPFCFWNFDQWKSYVQIQRKFCTRRNKHSKYFVIVVADSPIAHKSFPGAGVLQFTQSTRPCTFIWHDVLQTQTKAPEP
jgi:hypothetical protein